MGDDSARSFGATSRYMPMVEEAPSKLSRASLEDGAFSESAFDEEDEEDAAHDCAHSEACQNLVIAMILLNTIVMAMEADHPDFDGWPWVDNCFLLFFVGEITLKLCTAGCVQYFTDPKERAWNIFDFTIVAMGVLDQWVLKVFYAVASSHASSHSQGQPSFGKLVMIIRVLRILRVLRAVRLFKQFPALYCLVKGLIDSFQSVCWVAVLFALWLLVSAIVVTNLIGNKAEDFVDEDADIRAEDVRGWFGGIMTSMKTLFIYLTCDDWSTSARAANAKIPVMEIFWIIYMIIGAFTLLSLLTGLMADKMNAVREASKEDSRKEDERISREILALVAEAMKTKDENHDGCINFDEFQEMLGDKNFQRAREKLDIDVVPGEEANIYKALDMQGTNRVPYEEFVENLIALSKDEVEMKNVLWLEGALMKVDHAMSRYTSGGTPNSTTGGADSKARDKKPWGERVGELANRAVRLQEKVSMLQQDCVELMKSAGYNPN